MKKIQFETKALNDQTLAYAAQELRVNKDFIELNIVEEKKSLLGLNKSYIVEAIVDFNVINDGIEYIKKLLENMEIEAVIEGKQTGERNVLFTIDAKENPILIGKNGKTLEAIQNLLKNYINLYTDEFYIVLIDIGGYKEQRKKQLEILATKTAMEVVKTKVSTRLSKMNAYERRVIHTKLSDWRDVTTISEGEEPNRYIVITPSKK
ncbi:MAG: KH domain-containing protein [Candidatus Izemoplasmatales bacterium]|nr:KH domain-containing protein [Candidatus Izemoplasmatales bacterium]MDD4069614.1 KH domain-containing protein [Candidatus Izemoplasmatales bacterium]MDY0138435.1 RNA-binding cell elongation regulator Jag/EloR [Candidatus Izemoplasmatales bacterium]